MAGGVFSEAQLFGMTIRESATDGSDFTNPAADYRRLFLGEDGLLHLKDSAGTVTDVGAAGSGSITASGYTQSTARLLGRTTASSGAIEEITVGSGLSLAAGSLTATGGSISGYQAVWTPPHWSDSTSSTDATAGRAYGQLVMLVAPMYIEALYIRITANGSGSIEWGLFDASSTPTTCTKVAGGSAVPGGTGWRAIVATGAPDLVSAGMYVLITKNPDTNASTFARGVSAVALPFVGISQNTWTWDDTPDITTATGGWGAAPNTPMVYLSGDIDAAGTRFGA